ncbi:MAG: M67 family metallopeptidase [Planctomycetes bacterium]|nr:M67 family metallopeptidase [Planctomycetota bacterium]
MRRRLVAWAKKGRPDETCGLLVGRSSRERTEVVDVRFVRNLCPARASERYELDPDEHLAVELEARAAELEVVGVWHSHVEHPALPSEFDRAAAQPGWSYVIVAVADGARPELRAWRLDGDEFVEEPLDAG